MALLLYNSNVLKQKLAFKTALVKRIWKQQAEDGGIITEYDFDGNPVGDTNTETASIVVISMS